MIKKLLLLICLTPLFIKAQTIDVILIGGQSNATGQGYVRNIPRSFKVDQSVNFYYSKFLNRGVGGETWQPLQQASETKEKFGVELSLGTYLQKKYPNHRFALIKHALSGSNLYNQWNPGNQKNQKQGAEYKKFITTVKNGLRKLKEKGYTPQIKAMVWQQGEGDARDIAGMENSKVYAENLQNFILQVRKELNVPTMLFVYGEVIPMKAPRFTGRELIRQAQIDVSEKAKTNYSVKNAVLVETDDLEMRRHDYRTPMPKDDVHLGTYGILMLGERFAKEIVKRY